MDAPIPSSPPTRQPVKRRMWWISLGLLTVAMLGFGARSLWYSSRPTFPTAGESWEEKLYQNLDPGVKYVGDAACAGCHVSESETYQHHPMGRCLLPIADQAAHDRYDPASNNPFEGAGFQFLIERHGDKVVHRARRLGPAGQVVVEKTLPIHYVLGSGTRGYSYLTDLDGFVFQSPVSWFSQKHGWDLSPGFESIYPPERVVEESCLYCHANRVEAVPHSRNHFREPLFRGYSIGCERCHGPGELHVQARERGEVVWTKVDPTIVNPRDLSPDRREAVCQQCHLQGDERVPRYERKQSDYRPGLRLQDFWSVFVGAPGFNDRNKAVGQVEQMYSSRCFKESGGKLGCISCHDPHVLPSESERVAFYRDRCLACHAVGNCTAAQASRERVSDSCMACHMARRQSSDIVHTALTDHRILRAPSAAEPTQLVRPMPRPGEVPLVSFFTGPSYPDPSRELGLALVHLSRQPGPVRQMAVPLATPRLQEAVKKSPTDASAWEGLGWVLSLQSRQEEAMDAYREALKQVPDRETTLGMAAELAGLLGHLDEEISYLQQLRTLNPWIWKYRFELAKLLAQRGQWQSALDEIEKAVPLSPANAPTRLLLVDCLLHLGARSRAEKELGVLIALNPAEEKSLRSWFAEKR